MTRTQVSDFVLLAVLVTACGSLVDTSPPTAAPPPPAPALTGPGPFVVSNAVTIGPAGRAALEQSAGSDQVAFVSLVPGTLPGWTTVSLRVHRTGTVVSAALVDGGLDPVAVPAVEGDTVSLTVTGPAGAVTLYSFRVPPGKPPVIVRTVPRPNKRDVPLNLRLEVVFSEPIDAASLTPQSFELHSGGNPVPGQLTFANLEQTAVALTPETNLAPATDYQLVLHPSIRDLEGTPLEAGASISFTTAAAVTQTQFAGLAFVRDDQIHVIAPDGAVLQLTNTRPGVSNRDPAWSPDGQRLAFSSDRGGSWDLYVMAADGSNVVQRTTGGYVEEPAWSPDGRSIAFTRIVWETGRTTVSVIAADGGPGPQDFPLLDRIGYNEHPAWSPDGQKITFTSDWRAYDFLYDLYVMNADGSDVRPLLEGPFFWRDGLQFYFQSAWSPDGQRIAVVLCAWNHNNCYPDTAYPQASTIAVVNADGTGLQVIAQAGGYARPAWSPDGGTIAFASTSCPACLSSLRFVRADGSVEGLLLSNGHSPAWRR